MREILFRGFGINSREWHEGELINTRGFIPPYMPIILEPDEKSDGRAYDVYPESVGQFTGLTDKNGKKIFEGDIVRCLRFHCDGKEMVGHITYHASCFCVKENNGPNQPAMDLCVDFEVIGNIYGPG